MPIEIGHPNETCAISILSVSVPIRHAFQFASNEAVASSPYVRRMPSLPIPLLFEGRGNQSQSAISPPSPPLKGRGGGRGSAAGLYSSSRGLPPRWPQTSAVIPPSCQASERARPSRWPLRSQLYIPGFDTSAQKAQYIGLHPPRKMRMNCPEPVTRTHSRDKTALVSTNWRHRWLLGFGSQPPRL